MALNIDRLQSSLLKSKVQQSNNPLWFVISEIIKALQEVIARINGGGTTGGGSGTTINNIFNRTVFIPSEPGEDGEDGMIIIRQNGGNNIFVEWSVLTNGDPDFPELVFAGGDVIMTHTP